MKDREERRPEASSSPLRLVHETWGVHEALLARSRTVSGGRVGRVETKTIRVANQQNPFQLEHGGDLTQLDVAYETYGTLNADADNAILICHALTGSAHAAGVHATEGDRPEVPGWWDPLIGPGKAIDTDRFFVVSSNVLGGCYGTTGPVSELPSGEGSYGPTFPRYTIRDMVHVQKRLLDALGVAQLASVIGGSMGGMQVLEWGVMYPSFVRSIVPIATCARHSAWAIGLNEVARRAITSDPAWQSGRYDSGHQPEAGLGLARAIAMLSYRSYDSLEAKFGRDRVVGQVGMPVEPPKEENRNRREVLGEALNVGFEIESYLTYHGVQLSRRFDANTYLYLTRAMDDHDLSEGRGRLREVLANLRMPALVLGIDTDVLYPEREQRALVEGLRNARYEMIRSPHGHDAFLIEFPQLAAQLRRFLQKLD